jgi:hypothetical protein
MKKELAHELFHNFVLILFFGFCILAFYLVRYQKILQFIVVLIAAAFYLLWGIGYHWARNNLRPTIVFEYFILALTVFLIGLFLLFLP